MGEGVGVCVYCVCCVCVVGGYCVCASVLCIYVHAMNIDIPHAYSLPFLRPIERCFQMRQRKFARENFACVWTALQLSYERLGSHRTLPRTW